MQNIVFATGNHQKFATARDACRAFDIEVIQNDVDTLEIQSEDPEAVAIDKAIKSYQAVNQPIVITDDSWSFDGLNGFPGVYMHSMNHWFAPEDFLRLTNGLRNRTVTMTQYLVYHDGQNIKTFKQQAPGKLLGQIKGKSPFSSHTIIALDSDKGLSIAEAYDRAVDKSSRSTAKIWHDFAEWFATKS